jgi:methionyl-tRNA formyltransferase
MSNNSIKIIFFGNTDFSNPALLECNYHFNLKAVVTNASKKMGRGQKILDTPVMQLAKKKDFNIIEGNDLKDKKFINQLKDMNPDLFVVVAYKILPMELLEVPKYGSINIHSSLLPKYRGAAPIQHAILNQDKFSGISTFLIEPKVDTGKIIQQEKVEIGLNDNFGSLSEKLSIVGAKLIKSSVIKCLNKKSDLKIQDENKVTFAPKIKKEDLLIDWSKDADTILAKVKAFCPKPGAYTILNNKRVKIFEAQVLHNELNKKIGCIYNVEKDFFDIKCSKGSLRVTKVQMEGKKVMNCRDFIVGYQHLKSNILV